MEWVLLDQTDSTNQKALELARQGSPEGTAVLARRQTAGRGRRGRSFFSPEGGLYLSLILRPKLSPADFCLITPMAAAAVCQAIESRCGRFPKIKWVNDLILDGGKVCGILCEVTGDAVVVGIGVNYSAPAEGFPQELGQKAAALYPSNGGPVSRKALAEAIVQALLEGCRRLEQCGGLEEYQKRSFLPGNPVTVHPFSGPKYDAQALSVDERGRLLVRDDQGRVRILDSGEVSVRLLEG